MVDINPPQKLPGSVKHYSDGVFCGVGQCNSKGENKRYEKKQL